MPGKFSPVQIYSGPTRTGLHLRKRFKNWFKPRTRRKTVSEEKADKETAAILAEIKQFYKPTEGLSSWENLEGPNGPLRRAKDGLLYCDGD